MFKRVINIVLRLLAILLSGVVLAVPGFIVGSMVFAIFGFEFNGRQGYRRFSRFDRK